jgi:hypothetical protein
MPLPIVPTVCFANVVISILSTCLYFKFLWALQASPAFATQISAVVQALMSGIMLCVLDVAGLARARHQVAIPLRRWLELACWLSLQNTLEIASIDGLGSENSNLVPVMQQAVIPTTLVASSVLFGRRYSALHCVAAAIVVVGIAAAYAPIAVASAGGVPWWWAVVYLVSRVPQALANVRGEAVLRLQAADADKLVGPAECEAGPVRGWAALRTVLRAGAWTALLGERV